MFSIGCLPSAIGRPWCSRRGWNAGVDTYYPSGRQYLFPRPRTEMSLERAMERFGNAT